MGVTGSRWTGGASWLATLLCVLAVGSQGVAAQLLCFAHSDCNVNEYQSVCFEGHRYWLLSWVLAACEIICPVRIGRLVRMPPPLVHRYCDGGNTCFTCSFISPSTCDAFDNDCCSDEFLVQCPSNPANCDIAPPPAPPGGIDPGDPGSEGGGGFPGWTVASLILGSR
jgi:hypothetical protein